MVIEISIFAIFSLFMKTFNFIGFVVGLSSINTVYHALSLVAAALLSNSRTRFCLILRLHFNEAHKGRARPPEVN
jgi:hypothetical protein